MNSARAILEEVLLSEGECDEPATIDYQYRSKRNKLYINTLMLSEWMIDVPENFCDEWFMLPCPKGRRALIVARKVRMFILLYEYFKTVIVNIFIYTVS